MQISRRNFLRSSGLALGTMGLGSTLPGLFQRRIMAAPPEPEKRMIFIFQRGGNDGLNTCIPRGDSDYNTTNRPTLFIPETGALDSGNGFAQFHPVLQPMMEVYNNSAINGLDGPGNLAVLHRIGYPDQSRSHFDSEQYWENGIPGDSELDEGFIYRRLGQALDLNNPENNFVAASISGSLQVALKGDQTMPNFRSVSNIGFVNGGRDGQKFLGLPPTNPSAGDGSGLMGLYGRNTIDRDHPYDSLLRATGTALGNTMTIVQNASSQEYTPENGAVYPDGGRSGLGRKLMEAAMLFKRTPIQIIGMNLGGHDTHQSQGQLNGSHPNLLADLALGLQALSRDLQSMWDDLIVVTMSEFGRTSKENGSRGTDHGEAGVVFVAGGGVSGGVYNCDASLWPAGTMFDTRNRYVSHRTDFRAVFAEIFQRHFGDDHNLMDDIMPGYDVAAFDNPQAFSPLNFLNA